MAKTPTLDARASFGIGPREQVKALATVDPNVRGAQLGLTASAERAKTAEIKETDKAQAVEDKGKTSFFGELGSTRSVLTGLAALGALIGGEEEAALGIAIGGVVGTGQRVDTINQHRDTQQETALANAARDRSQDIEARKALVNTAVELEGSQFGAAVAVLQQNMSHEQKKEVMHLQNKFNNEEMTRTQNFTLKYQALVRADDREDVATARLMQLEVMELTELWQDRGALRDDGYKQGLLEIADRYRKEGVLVDQDFAEKMSAISAGYDRDAAAALFMTKLGIIDKYSDVRKEELTEKYGKDYAAILAAGTISLDTDETIRQDLESQQVSAVLIALREGTLASLPDSVRTSVLATMTDDEALAMDKLNSANMAYKTAIAQGIFAGMQAGDAQGVKNGFIALGYDENNEQVMATIDEAVIMIDKGNTLDAVKRLEPLMLAAATTESLQAYHDTLLATGDYLAAMDKLNWLETSSEVGIKMEHASSSARGRLITEWSKVTDPLALENPHVWITANATQEEGDALLATNSVDSLAAYLGNNPHNVIHDKILFEFNRMNEQVEGFAERTDNGAKMIEAARSVNSKERNAHEAVMKSEFLPLVDSFSASFGSEIRLITGSRADGLAAQQAMESIMETMSAVELSSPEVMMARSEDIKEQLVESIEQRDRESFTHLFKSLNRVQGMGIMAVGAALWVSIFHTDPFDEAIRDIKKGE